MKLRVLSAIASLVLLVACSGSATRSGENGAMREQAEVNTALGREYMSRGQYEIALEKLKKATSMDRSYAPAHTMLAVLYERIGDSKLAEKHYRRAIDIAPANGDVNNNFGAFLCQSGRAQKAEPYFLKAAKDPFYRTPAVVYANAGQCELQLDNLDKAENYLRQSLEYDAEFAVALLAMAKVSFRKEAHFRARAFLQRYEAAGTETAESLYLGFLIESSLQNVPGARKYTEDLLKRFPESRQAEEFQADDNEG
jgi:type IV pilus assembly protein PilF